MSKSHPAVGLFAITVCATAGLLAAIVAFTAVSGFADSALAAWTAGLAAAGTLAAVMSRRDPVPALAKVPRPFQVAFVVGAVAALTQLIVVTAFIVDPYRDRWRGGVLRPWGAVHSCVSAYWVAAKKATSVPDLYVETVYRPAVVANVPRQPNLGPFIVDVYEYPPTFLPLPRLLALVTADFWGFRRVWFALNLAAVVAGLVFIARRLDESLGTHTMWLTPWALAAPSVIGTFQVGNVQLLCLVASAAAMILFERGRPALGGLLLGYAIASKLYPGIFVFYLLLRRDWRAVGWTAAVGLALTLGTLADIGWTPMAAFFGHLPRILSGEAFPGLRVPAAIAVNESVPGLVFKAGLLGVPGMGFAAAQVVGWAYSVVLLAATAWLALRAPDRRFDPLAWIAILILATLRSPFLPTYGAFPSLWLATLMAGVLWSKPAARSLAAAAWVILALHHGQQVGSVPVNALVTFLHTVAALVLGLIAVPRVLAAPASPEKKRTPAGP